MPKKIIIFLFALYTFHRILIGDCHAFNTTQTTTIRPNAAVPTNNNTGSYKTVRQTGQAMPFQRNRKQWYQSIWRGSGDIQNLAYQQTQNMRGFGSIHFPDSYLFAPALSFIVHIANQSHYYNQQNKARSNPDGIAETIHIFIYTFYYIINKNSKRKKRHSGMYFPINLFRRFRFFT